jgi:tetrahydromethanopterin S-methyltransferase subunit B
VRNSKELWGAYIISGEGEKNVKVTLYDPKNIVEFLSDEDSREGKFKVKKPSAGNHRLCFKSSDTLVKSISFEIKSESVPVDVITVEEQVEPLEIGLRQVGRNMESVYRNLHFYSRREKVHRDISERNCEKILWAAILKISCLVTITLLQIWGLTHILERSSTNKI